MTTGLLSFTSFIAVAVSTAPLILFQCLRKTRENFKVLRDLNRLEREKRVLEKAFKQSQLQQNVAEEPDAFIQKERNSSLSKFKMNTAKERKKLKIYLQ